MSKGCPEEYPISLRVNGYEIAIFQLTKLDLEDWVYGYLYSEGLIDQPSDIKSVLVEAEEGTIRVELATSLQIDTFFSKKKHYTAGCGRGVTFFSMTDVKNFQPVHTKHHYLMSYLMEKRVEFAKATPLYIETGGMHAACIVEPNGELTVREDIGRHNAVDKIIGYALRKGLVAQDLILMTTGRISYEMLSKAAKFGFPVIASRTAATKQAVQLAKYLHIELIGYMRGKMSLSYNSVGRVTNDLVSHSD